ncbi:MAG: S-adenosylmethionine synthetase [Mogibacterium sp.]|nr:hypothetical protein [Bacteroidaceae bacterium]MBR3329829.1 S-adenosylmethionine synthetase [Mogibacterium sp.]
MFEKVNPFHPDKVADRIAGAITDIAYQYDTPKIATEVLIGHSTAQIIIETSLTDEQLNSTHVLEVMRRICPGIKPEAINIRIVAQDSHLAANQQGKIRCGDNGIFRGMPVTPEQRLLSFLAGDMALAFDADGKYIVDDSSHRLIICQSRAKSDEILKVATESLRMLDRADRYDIIINPLGDWTGGIDVDSGATNRKLGSDMGDAVTGGGLHGKDLSKADVSVNVVCHLLAVESNMKVEACCAIGDESITFRFDDSTSRVMPYAEVVEIARDYIINSELGFEKFAEYGLL